MLFDERRKTRPGFYREIKNAKDIKKLKLEELGIQYFGNSRAWMVSDIFCSWLRNINEKFKKESRKIILLLDNCSSHFNLSLSNVKLIFIPPNTSSLIQP
jgi:hypothetical protein